MALSRSPHCSGGPHAPERGTGRRLRHRFEPGRLLAGLVLLGAGIVSALDATGALGTGGPGALLLPMVVLGLCCAGVVGALAYGVRRRLARRTERGLPGPGGRRP